MKLFRGLSRQPAPKIGAATCPADAWACPASEGPVPEGFLGFCLNAAGQVDALAPPGCHLAAPRSHAAEAPMVFWWVRQKAWSFECAPSPELAPEAGLKITIEPFAAGPDYSLLARWLVLRRQAVSARQFNQLFQPLPLLKSLPPCIDTDQLGDLARALHAHAVNSWGLRVLQVQRCTLPRAADAPELDRETVSPESVAPAFAAEAVAVAAPPTEPGTEPWPTLVAADKIATQRLSRELAQLEQALHARWQGEAWATDIGIYERQRRLLQTLGRMASCFGRPVSLEQDFAKGREPSLAQRRLVAAAALKAVHTLGECWQGLEGLPQETAPDTADIAALEGAVQRLDVEVQRRLNAWWTLEG